MSLIRNLFFLFSVTVLALASLAISIFNYNPFTATTTQFIIFYTSLFVSLIGLMTYAIFYVKTKIINKKDEESHFWPSLRQGVMFSVCITTLLYLKGMGILDWWIGISTAVVTILLEGYFQTKDKK